MLENELKLPANPHKLLINLGLGTNFLMKLISSIGEPTKANGYELPSVISEAVIETIKAETFNGYTMSSGCIEARKAIVEK